MFHLSSHDTKRKCIWLIQRSILCISIKKLRPSLCLVNISVTLSYDQYQKKQNRTTDASLNLFFFKKKTPHRSILTRKKCLFSGLNIIQCKRLFIFGNTLWAGLSSWRGERSYFVIKLYFYTIDQAVEGRFLNLFWHFLARERTTMDMKKSN